LEGENDRELFIAFVTLLTASRAGLLESEMMLLLGHFEADRHQKVSIISYIMYFVFISDDVVPRAFLWARRATPRAIWRS